MRTLRDLLQGVVLDVSQQAVDERDALVLVHGQERQHVHRSEVLDGLGRLAPAGDHVNAAEVLGLDRIHRAGHDEVVAEHQRVTVVLGGQTPTS